MRRVAGLQVLRTPIEGLLVVELEVHADNRGWFKENWQRAKMVELGVPDFGPVQNNMSFNTTAGATRGIHAEPWDKFVSVARGRIFGAWVDLRPGPGFGTAFTLQLGVETAVFVPRGEEAPLGDVRHCVDHPGVIRNVHLKHATLSLALRRVAAVEKVARA